MRSLALRGGSLGDMPLIWTPSAIGSLKDQVNGEILSTATEATSVWAAGALSSRVFLPFRDFVHEWQSYRDDIGAIGLLWGATASTILEFQKRLVDWRKKLSEAGVSFSTPEPRRPESDSSLPTWAKWGLILAGVGVGAYALSKVTGAGKLLTSKG